MKKSIAKIALIAFVVSIVLSTTSCSRYVGESYGGSCGVWYPKKCKIGTKNW